MSTWIRFRYDNGDATLINAEETHLYFKADDCRIEVHEARPAEGPQEKRTPICTYTCEYPEQVSAAEELIFDALGKAESVTISLDLLDEHADYLNNVHGLRTVLTLVHQGVLRIPRNEELPEDKELFDEEETSEIRHLEQMLNTYLDVPPDSLRVAYNGGKDDSPFGIQKDHEECTEHGFHEYWVVTTQPDRNYTFRENFDELVRSLVEKEGYRWQEGSPATTARQRLSAFHS